MRSIRKNTICTATVLLLLAATPGSHRLFTIHRKSPETTSPNLGSRSFTHALRRTGGEIAVLRLIVIFVPAHAGNASAGWEFSQLSGG